MAKTITDQGITDAAESLNVEPAVIKAVAEVESRGDGFDSDGRPKILFERHKFHKYTGGKYDDSHPGISDPSAGGYGKAGAHQHARLDEALALNPEAAMKSASWGKFQIMGFNHKAAGFDSVDEFVAAMRESEDAQLKAFVSFIKSEGLVDDLKHHDWAGFARQYNGQDYKINKYDTKLAAAYKRHLGDAPEKPAEPKAFAAVPPVEIPPEDVAKGVTAGEPTSKPTEGVSESAPAVDVKASRPSIKSTAASIITFILGPLAYFGIDVKQAGQAGAQFAANNVGLAIKVAVGFGFVVLAAYIWNRAMDRAQERTNKLMTAAADKDLNNLRLVGDKETKAA